MYREGHHGINALLYAPIAVVTAFAVSLELAIVGVVLFVGLASVPDIDRHFDNNMQTHRSNLWTLIPIKHRGFTHTVWFAGLAGIAGAGITVVMAPQIDPVITLPFGFVMGFGGISGHIIGDALTPMGVRPFSPVKKTKYSLGICNASNSVANYGFLVTGGVALLAALGIGFNYVGIDVEALTAVLLPIIPRAETTAQALDTD